MSSHAYVGVQQYVQVLHCGRDVDRELMKRAEQHYLGLIVIQFKEVCSHPLANLSDAASYLFKKFSYIVRS